MKASRTMVGIVLGVKVRIYKNFNMGWSVRMKYKTSASTGEYEIPGMCRATESLNRTIWESLIPSFINYLFRIQ